MPGGGLTRMRGGPRQIQQDSQRLKGGGAVINKSAHKEGGLPDFLNIFVLVSNKYFQSSGINVHGLQAS